LLLQIGSKAVDELQGMTSLRLLRLEKSYWLPVEERWTQASQRAIARLKQARPDLQVGSENHSNIFRMAW
jgi:hypothetical protein